MRKSLLLVGFMLVVVLSGHIAPVSGQGSGESFDWPAPLNAGLMPENAPLLPPASAMPVLPLPEPLMAGTLLINAEDFSSDYRVLNLTFDERRYAYNISTGKGALPVSPNGHYGITTVNASVPGSVTCGIVDLTTNFQVDEFMTDGACSGVAWSPDSSRLLLPVVDAEGRQSLAIRQNGQNTLFRPLPTPESDLGGAVLTGDRLYIINGWISNTTFTFDIGTQGVLTEQLFTTVNDLEMAFPAISLTPTMADESIVLWRPAQPLGVVTRGLWITNLQTGDSFELAPRGSTAIIGDVSPDGTWIAYWAAQSGEFGPTHPLRLVLYNPSTDEHVVLLAFEGTSDFLMTRPGLVIWNPEGIYFHVSQQQDTENGLVTGAYRIQPDGTNLEYITDQLLMGSVE